MKTLFFILLLAASICFAQQPSPATSSIQLSWTPPTNTASPVTYRVYQGNSTGNYSTNFNAGTNLVYAVSNLTRGQTYYFAVTAEDTNNLISLFSNEANFTAMPSPNVPNNVHIIVITP